MNRLSMALLTVAIITGACAAVRRKTASETSEIALVQPSKPAEQLLAHGAFEKELHFKNTSKQSVYIDEIKASCECTSISPQKLKIGPGESKTVVATVDLLRNPNDRNYRFFTKVIPLADGRVLGVFNIEDDVYAPIGFGESDVRLTCSQLDSESAVEIPISLPKNIATRPVAASDSEHLDCDIRAGKTPGTSVLFLSTNFHEVGVQKCSVTVSVDVGEKTPQTTQRRLNVTIDCVEEIEALPQEIVMRGNNRSVSVGLRSGEEFRIRSLVLDSDQLEVVSETSPDWASSHELKVSHVAEKSLMSDSQLCLIVATRSGAELKTCIPILHLPTAE